MAMLNPEQYAGLFKGAGAGLGAEMMNYCLIDP
jgi:hypothetical protein